jgi:hypothetical protein
MSDHQQTVAAIYEAFGRGDIPVILECLDDNVAWEAWRDNRAQRAGVPWLAEQRGRQSVLNFFEAIRAWEFKSFQVLSLMAGERQVAAEIDLAVRLPDGKEFQEEEMHLWTFNDAGKVIRFRHYADTAKHIEAAGLA